MSQLEELFHKGFIPAVAARKSFDVSEVEHAIGYLSAVSAVEKVILTFENPGSLVKVSNRKETLFVV